MSKASMKFVILRGLIVLVIFFTAAVITYRSFYGVKILPILSPADINPKLVDKSLQGSFKVHKIGDFTLINQDGDTLTPLDFENKVYVANFIFTTCPGICPVMTKKMEQVFQTYYDTPNFSIISHSVTPEIDTVPVLKKFALQHYAVAPQWHFVTGDRTLIYDLARKHYFAALDYGDGSLQDFVHTENVVLIDPEKRIRGIYDGLDDEEMQQLINDIAVLLKQYAQ